MREIIDDLPEDQRAVIGIYINDEGTAREDTYFSAIGYDKSDGDIFMNNDTKTVYMYENYYVVGSGDWSRKNSITYNLNGVAKKVIGYVDMSDTNSDYHEGKVVFYDQNDKVIYESPTMRKATEPIPFEFPVSGILQLRVEFQSSGHGTHGPNIINLKDFRYSK